MSKKKITVNPQRSTRSADVVEQAIEARKSKSDVTVNAREWQEQNRRALSVYAGLQRVVNGAVTPEHVARGLHLDRDRNPRAYAAAVAAAKKVAHLASELGDRAGAMKCAADEATAVQEVIDGDGSDREMSRAEIVARVTGRHPH